MRNALNWFEIPAADIGRAVKFYSRVLAIDLAVIEIHPGYPMAMFPYEGGVGGAIVQGEGYTPSPDGSLVYLTFEADLNLALERVVEAGGQVLMPKTEIGESGFAAYILDTEGNKVGLHSLE